MTYATPAASDGHAPDALHALRAYLIAVHATMAARENMGASHEQTIIETRKTGATSTPPARLDLLDSMQEIEQLLAECVQTLANGQTTTTTAHTPTIIPENITIAFTCLLRYLLNGQTPPRVLLDALETQSAQTLKHI